MAYHRPPMGFIREKQDAIWLMVRFFYGVKMDKLKWALAQMTEIQRRRYKHYIKGHTLTMIAYQEKVSVEAVRKSIKSAPERVKKREKNLPKGLKKG